MKWSKTFDKAKKIVEDWWNFVGTGGRCVIGSLVLGGILPYCWKYVEEVRDLGSPVICNDSSSHIKMVFDEIWDVDSWTIVGLDRGEDRTESSRFIIMFCSEVNGIEACEVDKNMRSKCLVSPYRSEDTSFSRMKMGRRRSSRSDLDSNFK